MKIKVIDMETKEETVYDYSNHNWLNRYACMRGGLVHMWAPREVQRGGYVITSGRKWMLLGEGER
jgi:hypothetical protein